MKTAASMDSQSSHAATGGTPAPPEKVLTQGPAATADPPPPSEAPAKPPVHRYRKWLLLAGTVAVLVVGGYFLVPWVNTALNTVSTDDAYVNGHVTLVAPRVTGQVKQVLVDDNERVKKGDLLVQLDKEPFQVQVSLKRAAVRVAEANLTAAEAKARGLEALANSQRWKIRTASQLVKNQIALLHARVAALRTKEATLDRARADFERSRRLLPSGAESREAFDQHQQDFRVAQASVNQAREEVYQVRSSLGLPLQPEKGKDFTDVPPDLDQTPAQLNDAGKTRWGGSAPPKKLWNASVRSSRQG